MGKPEPGAGSIIPAAQTFPNKLFIMPLTGKPIFPGIFTPVMLVNPDDIALVEQSLSGDSHIGMVMAKSADNEKSSAVDIFSVGTIARIVKKINLPDGGINIFISTLKRFKIRKILKDVSPIIAAVSYLEDEDETGIEVKALTRAIIGEMKQISENNPLFSEEMRLNMVNIDHPGKIADFIASILNIDRREQQRILETTNVHKRMEQVLLFIKKEQELLRIQKKIQNQINEKIEKSQREYFLKEQMKTIKQELGMPTDAKSSEYQKFKETVEKLDLSGEVKEQVEQELEKFSLMDPNVSEFIVTRNYLDMITSLPWNEPKPESIDMKKAKRVLDSDHYGLDDVKERILEYLAVRKLKNDTKGSILCLAGPPGVGKTSVGKSIAGALGKQFFRFSVGGMRDEAEIKGHRRTYIGAMPGKIIQGLKIVKTKDPVFMIDEIDKLGSSYQGDPSSALLEVLDPEQNVAFRDHYLDLPFDISHILFIATANTLDTIPQPLVDRMEVIRLSGYIESEKIAIAKRYLIPKSLNASGLTREQVKYAPEALMGIARGYSREAGLRNYEKALDRIHRKIARKVVLDDIKLPTLITDKDLEGYLGRPVFSDEEIKRVFIPGQAVGLAWTTFGGDTLMIEAVANPGKEGISLTGQMGDVMQESAKIAYTWVRTAAQEFGIGPDYFEKNHIHLHIPAGATPKDGPSAGITMASALLSLVRGKKIRKNLAMTGELSLVGNVLPIGGLKEKTIAARRGGIKEIIIPRQNEKDLAEIPQHIRKGIKFHSVEKMDEVVASIF
ncbi:MAG: endopeptidase La [Spirochaetales bacterium]|jgi:ATP-dependent Lon protease|nr:endopeptidase La [Spirochaetales bacterium]